MCFFFQAEDGIRDLVRSRGLGDVYKRQATISEDREQRFQAIVSTVWRCRTLRPTTQPGYGFLIQPMRKPDAYPEIVDAPDPRSSTSVSYTHLTLPTSDLV